MQLQRGPVQGHGALCGLLAGVGVPVSDLDTVPCAVCGEPTRMASTVRCNNCWEVEGRLWKYLQSSRARQAVRELLNLAIEAATLRGSAP